MKKKISAYAKEHGVSYRTIWRMVKAGKLPHEVLPSGTIVILDEPTEVTKGVVLYARVSSSENKKNLDMQLQRLRDYAAVKGYKITKEVKEVGSGLNDKRQKLESILAADNWAILLVEHKDRLARFGLNYLQILLRKSNKAIEIINSVEENSKEDLLQDFVSIITSFTARLYGLRRSKRKTEQLIKELQNDTK